MWMRDKRKICVVTGTRAEYGILKALLKKIKESNKLKLQIIATGMHLLPEFGLTVKEIEKDGFKVNAKVPTMAGGDDKASMAISIGAGIVGLTKAIEKPSPDIVVVFGDRFEMLAAAVAAAYSGRVVAHLSGGDSPRAGYDEYSRHAITKISHLHFPTTRTSAERIIKMGEDPKYVFTVGSTAIDTILNVKKPPKEFLCKKYNLDVDEPILLVVQHPVSTDPETAENQITITLAAVIELGYQVILIYPNADPGGRRIIKVIKKFKQKYPEKIHAYESLPFEDYLGIMKIADVMVGNSSSGIIEAPSFHLPVINIGLRQEGRDRSQNVIDVGHDKGQIKRAINKALHDKKFREKVGRCKNPYGDGKASERIVRILRKIKLEKKLLQKKITY